MKYREKKDMTRASHVFRIVMQLGTVAIFVVALITAALRLLPYSDLTVTPLTNVQVLNVDGEGKVTDNFVTLLIEEFCNDGVDVESTRELLVWDEFSVFESQGNVTAILFLPPVVFIPPEPQCGTDVEVRIPLPDSNQVPDGIYSIRSQNRYQPNPIRFIDVTYETEQFELHREPA